MCYSYWRTWSLSNCDLTWESGVLTALQWSQRVTISVWYVKLDMITVIALPVNAYKINPRRTELKEMIRWTIDRFISKLRLRQCVPTVWRGTDFNPRTGSVHWPKKALLVKIHRSLPFLMFEQRSNALCLFTVNKRTNITSCFRFRTLKTPNWDPQCSQQ